MAIFCLERRSRKYKRRATAKPSARGTSIPAPIPALAAVSEGHGLLIGVGGQEPDVSKMLVGFVELVGLVVELIVLVELIGLVGLPVVVELDDESELWTFLESAK